MRRYRCVKQIGIAIRDHSSSGQIVELSCNADVVVAYSDVAKIRLSTTSRLRLYSRDTAAFLVESPFMLKIGMMRECEYS